MNIFTKQTVNQYLHVLAVIFPLTLIVPMFMLPLLQLIQIPAKSLLGVFMSDIMVVGLAVFIFIPLLKNITSKLISPRKVITKLNKPRQMLAED